ncbi:glycosyltransferase [Mangrovimonas sp. ST2L15]|uniref:glycosyltransferase n=1 Tax=Mangrovimonas sp. ST2L15 TaxID=1645916 RepID=UPI0006B6743A|nr:glycosyltransferase [Mangrovimonas sp. ST2L15]
MKKALVHDWYYVNGGAEKVIHSMNNVYDDFEHFALIDFLNYDDKKSILKSKPVNTSFIQNFPGAKRNHRRYLPFFPMAIEQFDLRNYDLVVSSSSSVSKGVLTNHNQLHICYCHSPMRYAWDFYHEYLSNANLTSGLKSYFAKYILHKIRVWDVINSNRVDFFIANSHYIAKRIKKIYNRESIVIYPPVDVESFKVDSNKENYYFTASRLVSYKRMDLIIGAFNQMPEKKLIISGNGPEMKRLKKMAKSNIEFTGFLSQSDLHKYMSSAKAFVFAAEEDFGIIPVEAQACGTPIIGLGKGGINETVLHDKTGVLFRDQDIKSIKGAIDYFETKKFNPEEIRKHAEKFSRKRFENEFKTFVEEKYQEFKLKQVNSI